MSRVALHSLLVIHVLCCSSLYCTGKRVYVHRNNRIELIAVRTRSLCLCSNFDSKISSETSSSKRNILNVDAYSILSVSTSASSSNRLNTSSLQLSSFISFLIKALIPLSSSFFTHPLLFDFFIHQLSHKMEEKFGIIIINLLPFSQGIRRVPGPCQQSASSTPSESSASVYQGCCWAVRIRISSYVRSQ